MRLSDVEIDPGTHSSHIRLSGYYTRSCQKPEPNFYPERSFYSGFNISDGSPALSILTRDGFYCEIFTHHDVGSRRCRHNSEFTRQLSPRKAKGGVFITALPIFIPDRAGESVENALFVCKSNQNEGGLAVTCRSRFSDQTYNSVIENGRLMKFELDCIGDAHNICQFSLTSGRGLGLKKSRVASEK